MAGQTVSDDLLTPLGSSKPMRPFSVCVQLSRATGTGFSLLCRMTASELTEILGARIGADLAHLSRHLEAKAALRDGGITITVGFTRAKLGPPLARPVADEEGDWILGPIALPSPRPEQAVLLKDYERQGLLPLTWRDVQAEAGLSTINLPDLLALRAVVGDDEAILLPGAQAARRRAARAAATRRARPLKTSPALPFDTPQPNVQPSDQVRAEGMNTLQPSLPTEPLPARAARSRRRIGAIRLSAGNDGRIGLTIPPDSMESLWAGRAESDRRCCHIVISGRDVLLLPEDDPLAGHLAATALTMTFTTPNWYGRTSVRDAASPACAALRNLQPNALRAGRDFEADVQPGRIVLRDLLSRSVATSPQPDAVLTETLAKARQLMTEALGLLRSARDQAGAVGMPEVEIIDACGMRLLTVPAEAADVRVRLEIV